MVFTGGVKEHMKIEGKKMCRITGGSGVKGPVEPVKQGGVGGVMVGVSAAHGDGPFSQSRLFQGLSLFPASAIICCLPSRINNIHWLCIGTFNAPITTDTA